jgi:hypothetical protein
MVEHFEKLGRYSGELNSNIYTCFSSRHYPYINFRRGLSLTLENQQGHGYDIGRYVWGNLRAGDDDITEDMKTEILIKAVGTFIWAVVVVT